MTGTGRTGLDARIRLRAGSLDVDVELRATAGETLGLVGPNGAGKTTIVRALAGLIGIDDGRISLGDRILDDPAAGVFVAAEDRHVGVVFQDHLLFPRMTVLDNVAFGLRAAGASRGAAAGSAGAWIDRFGLSEQASAKPARLSGGQSQRVALARALATDPELLLLDEPLAALDASTRLQVRAELGRHLGDYDGVRVLVTHDPIDALVLADRLVIIEGGVVVQTGTPEEVAARPASRYAADLVGINLLRGRRLDEHTVALDAGGRLTVAARAAGEPTQVGVVALAIRPQAVALHREQPTGSPRNAWTGTIEHLERAGDRVRVELSGPVPLVAEVTSEAEAALGLRTGELIWASVKAVDIEAYRA